MVELMWRARRSATRSPWSPEHDATGSHPAPTHRRPRTTRAPSRRARQFVHRPALVREKSDQPRSTNREERPVGELRDRDLARRAVLEPPTRRGDIDRAHVSVVSLVPTRLLAVGGGARQGHCIRKTRPHRSRRCHSQEGVARDQNRSERCRVETGIAIPNRRSPSLSI